MNIEEIVLKDIEEKKQKTLKLQKEASLKTIEDQVKILSNQYDELISLCVEDLTIIQQAIEKRIEIENKIQEYKEVMGEQTV